MFPKWLSRSLVSAVVAIPAFETASFLSPLPARADEVVHLAVIRDPSNGRMAVVQGGKRRWISHCVAPRLPLTPANVTEVTHAQYESVAEGPDFYLDGWVLRDKDTGYIGVYANGKIHHVSEEVRAKMGLGGPNSVIHVEHWIMEKIPQGSDFFPGLVKLRF
jgi:hypothetical protein